MELRPNNGYKTTSFTSGYYPYGCNSSIYAKIHIFKPLGWVPCTSTTSTSSTSTTTTIAPTTTTTTTTIQPTTTTSTTIPSTTTTTTTAAPTTTTTTTTIDINAQAFITATQISTPSMITAIDIFVRSMKSAGLWNKMAFIYPMVSDGINQTRAFQHKFNLKDPRDLDVAYRLAFLGGETHDSQGVLGFAPVVTFFKPAFIPNSNIDYHISYYTGSNTLYPNDSGSYTMGCDSGGNNAYNLIVNRTNYPCVSWIGSVSIFSTTSVTGLVSGVRSGVNNKIFLNGILKNNDTSGNDISTAVNATATLFNGANAKCQYASISSAFTDAEILTYYNIVQTLQTALGRQV